jgi:hypothetical protein
MYFKYAYRDDEYATENCINFNPFPKLLGMYKSTVVVVIYEIILHTNHFVLGEVLLLLVARNYSSFQVE